MIPFRFGSFHHHLLGLYHAGEAGRAKPAGVLMCNPFGQEAVRAHRMFRVLAERLARLGMHVLRFDYFGTGDSEGDDVEGDLDHWRNDIAQAHEELRRRVPGADIHWLGARLGASLACLAAGHGTAAPQGLILWEPVLDGTAYLSEMARSHPRALAASYSLVPSAYRQPSRGEALGFGLGEKLLSQLERLRCETLPAVRARQAILIASSDRDPSTSALAEQFNRQGLANRTIVFKHAFDWASEEALNTALVPAEAMQLLLDAVEGMALE